MGLKCFEIPLECGHFIAIELAIFNGQVTSFVVRLMAHSENGDIRDFKENHEAYLQQIISSENARP